MFRATLVSSVDPSRPVGLLKRGSLDGDILRKELYVDRNVCLLTFPNPIPHSKRLGLSRGT